MALLTTYNRRTLTLLSAACAALIALSAASRAEAATVEAPSAFNDNSFVVTADSGNLSIGVNDDGGGQVSVFDNGANQDDLESGTGCSGDPTGQVCVDPSGGLLPLKLRVVSADGNDNIWVQGPFEVTAETGAGDDQVGGGSGMMSARIEAGDGNDYLSGSDGADHLDGGPGQDFFDAGDGDDRVVADDGEQDAYVDCGPGEDTATGDEADAANSNRCEGGVPDTEITFGDGPKLGSSAEVIYEAKATQWGQPAFGMTYECQKDGGAWVVATYGTCNFTSVAVGDHTFRVRAINADGDADPTPAEFNASYDENDLNVSAPDFSIAPGETKELPYDITNSSGGDITAANNAYFYGYAAPELTVTSVDCAGQPEYHNFYAGTYTEFGCTELVIPAGQTVRVTVTVVGGRAGPAWVNASVGANYSGDPDTGNNSRNQTFEVAEAPDPVTPDPDEDEQQGQNHQGADPVKPEPDPIVVDPKPEPPVCGQSGLYLIRTDVAGERVRLSGVVGKTHAGQAVTIQAARQLEGGKLSKFKAIATARVAGDEFSAVVRRPGRKDLPVMRYRAVVGTTTSKALKLPQAIFTARSAKSNPKGHALITGQIRREFIGKKRVHVTLRQFACGKYRTVGSVRPDKQGRYKLIVKAPTNGHAAYFRAEARLLGKPGSERYIKRYARAIRVAPVKQIVSNR